MQVHKNQIATFQRNKDIVEAVAAGETLRAVGTRFGVTGETVRKIVCRAERKSRLQTDFDLDTPLSDLLINERLRNSLENMGCATLREAANFTPKKLLSQPNFGEASLSELECLVAKAAGIERCAQVAGLRT